jgi:hypothetical protein
MLRPTTRELRANLADILDAVIRGEEVQIERAGTLYRIKLEPVLQAASLFADPA